MAVRIDISIIGDKELQRKLNRLPDRVQKKVLQQAFRKAAKSIKAKAEAKIPVDSGKLKSVGLKIGTVKRSKGRIGIAIFTPTRAQLGIAADSKFYYPAHLELGHGNVAPRPFMRSTMDSERPRALASIAKDLRIGIEREAKR